MGGLIDQESTVYMKGLTPSTGGPASFRFSRDDEVVIIWGCGVGTRDAWAVPVVKRNILDSYEGR